MATPLHSLPRLLLLPLTAGLALALLGGLLLTLGHAQSALAQPLVTEFGVTNTNDSGAGSLRQALLDANANPGADIVHITAQGTVLLLSPLPAITETVTIQGPGASLFQVDAQAQFRVFDISHADATLSDLTIQRGSVPAASENGAGLRSNRALTLTNVHVLTNSAASHGGGVYVSGDLTVTNGLFQHNQVLSGTGGALRSSGAANLSGTHFVGNTSRGDGGAVFALVAVTLTNVTLQNNQCLAGACDGGALFGFSRTTLVNTHFINNTAQDTGGAAAAPGVVHVTGGLFQGNHAAFNAGGGLHAAGTLELNGTQFLTNTARTQGGGLFAGGAVTLTDSLFLGNQAVIGQGGGLAVRGALYLSGTQFLRNSAPHGGGLSHELDHGYLVNSLFAGNVASATLGAALLLASPGSVDVVHTTLAAPAVVGGSAVQVLTGTVSVTNTIVASHSVGLSVTAGTLIQDYSLFYANSQDIQGAVTGGAHTRAGDPRFVDPAGGNYRLSVGSAAIDAGTPAGVVVDFEGHARPQFFGFDIGFAEFIPRLVFIPLLGR